MKISKSASFEALKVSSVMDFFDVGWAAAVTLMIAALAFAVVAVSFFVHSAPPTEITFTAGPEGSAFYKAALQYQKILKENGVSVHVLNSQGSSENLRRLTKRELNVDVGMVQGGMITDASSTLVSLGSVSKQPVLVFYRGKQIQFLSELKGKKISIGPEGSGANQLARTILGLNGIKEDGRTQISIEDSLGASQKLQNHLIDAAFIMSESASVEILKSLVRADGIRLYDFPQANAYVRKLNYLVPLTLPEGAIDLGENIPSDDVHLVGPTVELIAEKSLHPALSDLLLEAATQIHGKPGLFQQRAEFPAPVENTFRISEDAKRYYKSGKSFFYRYLPYWLASLLSRIVVVFVPALVLFIPVMKVILAFFQWRVRLGIRKRYSELLILERSLQEETDPVRKLALRKNFERIEDNVRKMPVKGSFADQIYALRGHIDYVKSRVGMTADAKS